jgi:hypothetical protein
MATRRPLVLIGGRSKELPAGDHLPAGLSFDPKAVGVISPIVSSKAFMFKTTTGGTISKITSVLPGASGSPSVTFDVKFGSDVSAAGTDVVTAGITTTNVSTGTSTTSFDNAVIPANSFVWVEVTAKSGTVPLLHVTLEF